VWPHITLTVLVFLFGAYALVDGVFAIIAGVKSHGQYKRWWLLLIEGLLSVAAGVYAFAVPAMTAFILLILIASWAIVTGLFEIAAAIQLRKHVKGEWVGSEWTRVSAFWRGPAAESQRRSVGSDLDHCRLLHTLWHSSGGAWG